MPLNINIDNITLDVISTRLKNVVSPLDILKWLSNFEKNEVELAIGILNNLTVYTTYEIEEILHSGFTELNKNLEPKQRLIVHPIGKFGKSGSMISYLFQKTSFHSKNKNRLVLMPSMNNLEQEGEDKEVLVLIDDFVGSGNTIETYFNKNIAPLKGRFKKIFFIGIAGMNYAIDKIAPLFNGIIIPKSNYFLKAFSNDASFFGYRKFHKHRDLAYKYGVQLTSPIKLKNGNLKHVDALGFQNSQSLVCFSYGSPNNTLPIIYSHSNKNVEWIPLIPRFSQDKISTARNYRKNILHELAILKEFGSENIKDTFFSLKIMRGHKTFSSVNHIDFSLYAIIKMIRSGFNDVSICQKLGILHDDYKRYIEEGIKKGVFSKGNILTLFGLELYQDAKKCIEKRRRSLNYETVDSFTFKTVKYIPKTFNGRS